MEKPRSLTTRDGANIAWRTTRPEAPRGTLVLIHGLASNLSRWAELVSSTRLADSWTLIRIDLRGHGDSLWRGRIGMGEWCADLAAVLDAEGVSRAVLLGHCLGANVALHFAGRHPDRVESLVLVEPMFRDALAGTLARVSRLRAIIQPVILMLRALAAIGVHRRRLATLDLEALDRETRKEIARTGAFPEARYASYFEDLKAMPTVAYLQDLLAITEDVPDLEAIGVPTLAILSRGTSLSDPGRTAEHLARIRNVEIAHLDAQHWIPTEKPEALREAVETWCESLRG